MEDKVFLDEAGLEEVGKVISKHYAKREDLDRDKKKKEVLFALIGNPNLYPYSKYNYLLLEGVYYVDLHDLSMSLLNQVVGEKYSDRYLYSLWEQGRLPDLSLGVAVIQHYAKGDGDEILQSFYDIATGLKFQRRTKESKLEYKEDWIMDNYDIGEMTILDSLYSGEAWDVWMIGGNIVSSVLPVFPGELNDGYKPGLMTPDDKKKLDSINVDAINSGNNSNFNTIKVCDVEKEVLSKGADAPVGYFIDSKAKGQHIKLYKVYSDRSDKFYYCIEFGAKLANGPLRTSGWMWHNNSWIANIEVQPAPQPPVDIVEPPKGSVE